MNPEILFEDNHLLIINKKAGELAQGDETGDIPLIDSLKSYIKKRDNKPGNVFLGLVHRLDRPTSGVLIFAKTSKALTRMNEMFQKRNIDKVYRAIVQNKPPHNFERLEHYLKKNPKNNKTTVYPKPTGDAKKAILEYTYLGALDSFHYVEVKLFTGRSHQIRAQLSSVGSPIKGDLKYGAKRSNPDGSISLHAYRITFEHPVKKEEITIIAPVPKDAIWQATTKL
ncbi:RluA family pseudouridine synthase [Chishuiella sp.]|uniref:RluA family pseudouridine synthase n=1 Tax=Chishuiella sp. TaxID=1969467 RepID=UPI0028B02FFB|nr:RluA family pseudouridine synthase [Chishuiella sp.]